MKINREFILLFIASASLVLFVAAERQRPQFRCCSAGRAFHSLKPPRNATMQLVSTTESRNETITFGEQIFRMVFKRNAKKEDGENKKEEPKTEESKKSEGTTATGAPSEAKDEKADKKTKHHHKSGHKKHKHKHHHHTKDNNGTDVDWHSIG